MPHTIPKNTAFDYTKYRPFAFAPQLKDRTSNLGER